VDAAAPPDPLPNTFSRRPVAMRPGQIVLTVMRCAATSSDSVFA